MRLNGEKGYALPIVMIIVMAGALLVPPFLDHTGTSLVGSRVYADAMREQYAADAGAEFAIWKLADGGLAGDLPDPGDTIDYTLPEIVNGLAASVVITNKNDIYENGFGITAAAGGSTLEAVVIVAGGAARIVSWHFD